jgi:hypothetical protein
VADGDESLLDVFVNIRPDPNFQDIIRTSANEAIAEYARIFSTASIPSPRIGPPNVSGGGSGGGGGGASNGGGGGGGGGGGNPGNYLRDELRRAILEFQRDKAFLEIDVRIANDKDLQDRLRNITSNVAGQANAFRATENEDEQLNALIRIVDLRERDLALLREATAEQIRAAGLGTSAFDRNLGFREQRNAVESSLLGIKGVGKTINAADDSGMRRQFEVLNQMLDQAQLKLKQGIGAENLIDVTEARERIQRITDDIDALRIKAEAKIVVDLQVKADQAAIKEQFDYISSNAKEQMSRGRIEDKLQSSLIRGLPSGEMRENIARMRAELELAELEVRKLSQGFDGSQDSVDRLVTSVQKLTIAQQGLQEMHVNAKAASGSMNTLSNNAYQLGQAFEDAAVGYSLNGLAGAFRGASNNINFLINDVLRLKAVQDKLGDGLAAKVTVGAAVATAVTTLVLPALLEWLESLNDIEAKFEDISDVIRNDFADVKFDVGLEGSEREFFRTIQQAKELKEVLESLGEVSQKSKDQADDLQKVFQGLDKTDSLTDALAQIAAFEKILDAEVERKSTVTVIVPQSQRKNPLSGVPETETRVLREGEDPAYDKLKKQLEEIRLLNENLRKSVADGYFGNSDVDQLKKTEEAFKKVKESASSVLSEADLVDEKGADKFDATIGALQETIDKVGESRRQIESLNKQISEGFTNSQAKFDEFLAKQKLIREVIAGTKNEQELFVFEARKSVIAYDNLIEKVRAAKVEIAKGKDGIANQPFEVEMIRLANTEARRAREALRMEAETVLLQKKKEIEEEIEKIQDRKDRKKSISSTLDKYPEILQRNVLSTGAEDDNTEQLKRLTSELQTIEEAIRELNQTMSSDRDGILQKINQWLEMAKFGTQISSSPYAKAAGTAVDLFQGFLNARKPEDFRDGFSDVLKSKETFADAIRIGVEQGMKEAVRFITGAQFETTDAVKKMPNGATAR